jgi:hypothetical protein
MLEARAGKTSDEVEALRIAATIARVCACFSDHDLKMLLKRV